MEKSLFLLACQLKMMNLFYHNSHNLVKGPLFNQDHAHFAELYEAVEGDYDDVVERAIGMGLESVADLQNQLQVITQKISKIPTQNIDNDERFEIGLGLEVELCKIVEIICKSKPSTGLEQLIGEIGNQSEIRQYKLKQRLK